MRYPGLKITAAPSLAELTSIRLGGEAIARVLAEDEASLDALPEVLAGLGGKAAILGQGSNILAHDGPLPLVLLELGEAFRKREPRLLEETGNTARVTASAALPLPLFLNTLFRLGLGGLSGLSGIPGRLGGAIAMNAGSFGQEIGDRLRRVRLFTPELGIRILEEEDLDLGYRRFTLPPSLRCPEPGGWFLILGAEFLLPRQAPESIKAEMQSSLRRKAETQPLNLPSAGCVFKNPPGQKAGKLLEEAGFRGRSRGGLAFSSVHANFLVNTSGRGRADDAFALILEAREAVLARNGVLMETEVEIWP
ncbi:MAG: UDP-N-acetylmuramate dehydrogenase [Deltaproteobacteria bacterium]|jgi:UDP-N-acetylmuramate dehydrogenase|nr:UDP-N-acetylmuramate dehydrogenase [Deltaproteobacteria bacterium]